MPGQKAALSSFSETRALLLTVLVGRVGFATSG